MLVDPAERSRFRALIVEAVTGIPDPEDTGH